MSAVRRRCLTNEAKKSAEKACYYFNTPDGCWFGDRCRYSHVSKVPKGLKPVCKFFGTEGGCRFGSTCRFSHDQVQLDTVNELLSKDVLPAAAASKSSHDQGVQKQDADGSPGDADGSPGNAVGSPEGDEDKLEDEEENSEDWESLDDEEEDEYEPPKEVKCGECGAEFKREGDEDQELFEARLVYHYMDKLGAGDKDHLKYFKTHSKYFTDLMCIACSKKFSKPANLFQHMQAMRTSKKKGHDHTCSFEHMVEPFAERDLGTGMIDDERDLLRMLRMAMSVTYSDSEDDCFNGMNRYFSHQLQRLINNGSDLSDETEERAMNFGFTEDECEELLCQGVKPWDEEAYAVLAVLNDY